MTSRSLILLLLLALVLSAGVLSACGGDDEESGGQTAASGVAGNGIDRSFIAEMIPHHESAVEMARMAEERAESQFVRGLAANIIETQNAEITTLRRIDAQLKDVKAEDLGVADHMKGMDADMTELEKADPFDKAFIDMMVPHHKGAIEMAKVKLKKGDNPELKTLAQAIIDAQQREISEMNKHREEAYGGAVPEANGHGAVNPQGESTATQPRKPSPKAVRATVAVGNGPRDRQPIVPVAAK